MPHRPFDRWSLRLLVIGGGIAWLTSYVAVNLPDPELVSTRNASAEVVLVGTTPDPNTSRVGRYGISVGPVGGSSPSGRVRLDDGSEYFVLFYGGRPKTGARVAVLVGTFDDGSRRVRMDPGY